MASPGKTAEDEYTDYSCSTSTERLARDVETLLRSWHVDKGNDRHISMSNNNAANNAAALHNSNNNSNSNGSFNPANTDTLSQQQHHHQHQQTTMQFPASGASSVASGMSSSTAGMSARTPSTISIAPSSSTLLLRSDTLIWNVSLTTSGRLVSFTMELQLSLWDGPASSTTTTDEDDEDENNDEHAELPHALRRSAQMRQMSPWMFENMSHLFGIGQHLTLTPRHSPTCNPQNMFRPGGDLQCLAQSILQRHDDETTAGIILFQVLSGWLQTALNCAVSNCQCCIPVFGFWGNYHPEAGYNNRRRQRQRNSTPQTSSSSKPGDLQVFPTWMEDILHTELPELPRMTRKQFLDLRSARNQQNVPPVMTGMVLPTLSTAGNFWCSVIPGHPKSSSRLTLWGNILLQHCPDDTVVMWCARHVFAWWKQPLQKASAFQMLFQPDNYQFENANNPYTAWRRTPKQQQDAANNNNSNNNGTSTTSNATTSATTSTTTGGAGQPPIIISKPSFDGKVPHQIIDLTGEYYNNDNDGGGDTMPAYYSRLDEYQNQCRSLGIALLDQAAGASASEPRWGPVDDPVAAIHATATWNGSPIATNHNVNDNNNNNSNESPDSSQNPINSNKNTDPLTPKQPLLSFPLRIRSKHTMSAEDWVEMEDSVERTILDPALASNVQLQTWWDLETPVASLAATQQCVLAALIRTSTLPDETLLKHITDDNVLEQWDNASGNVVASCLAQQAQVGPTTRALVEAMDWETSAEDKMEMRDAEVLIRHILKPNNGSDFPMPPTSPLADSLRNAANNEMKSNAATSMGTPARRRASLVGVTPIRTPDAPPESQTSATAVPSNSFAPLFKSAPIGRLVSILCVHMGRVRSPCSMAMLWIAFCHEVRMRWEHRMSLPHMNYVQGMDPSSVEMKERNRSLCSLGVKAEHAAFWQGPPMSKSACAVIQPDTEFPGDHHCLIGQKLQVVNLCIDMVAATEARRQQRHQEQEQLEKRPRLGDDVGVDREYNRTVLKQKIEEASRGVSGRSSSNDVAGSDEFVDPMSESEYVDQTNRRPSFKKKNQPARKGARCPVPGSSLVQTGGQLYAPYFQRPYPLTDDVIAERHMMLSRHYDPLQASQHGVHKRLEISYRLQKPKLLSDMCAFKAANPGSIFQDFINWYGNPGNPLDDYSDTRNRQNAGATIGDLLLSRAATESVAMKLDKAAEAIQMLNETREFWSRTWEEASPIPASDQKLLFDVTSTVEMALDFMENMHPAILVNQVMAVNIAVSYFTIVGAAKDAGVHKVGGLIKRSFQRLRKRTEQALDLLSGDATRSTSGSLSDMGHQEGSSSFISLSAISACDAACAALSEAEVLTARATSLLHKFPGRYALVDSILRHEPGHEIPLLDQKGQAHILQVIHDQQMQNQPKASAGTPPDPKLSLGPRPALREYVLRNLDDSNPCQLSVRFADEVVMLNNKNATSHAGGMLLALTKSLAE